MDRTLSRLVAVALVAVLLVQGVGAGLASSAGQSAETTSPADEIYVEENGDAVLVYESGSAGDANRTEFGVDVDENVAYLLLLEDPVANTSGMTGGLEATANRTAISADGNLSMPRPDALEAFSLTATGETTRETSRGDLTLSTTLRDESGTSNLLTAATTNGTVTTTADRLTASADLHVDSAIPLPENAHESLDFALREDGDAFVLSMDESRSVTARSDDVARNRSAAVRGLRSQYDSLASEMGGTATVDVESYSVENASDHLRVEETYTVRFEGIDEGIGTLVRDELAEGSEIDADQVDALASGLRDVDVDEFAVEYRIDGDGLRGSLDVDVANYSSLAMAYFDAVGSIDQSQSDEAEIERMENQFEAQRAADLEQRFTWTGNLTQPDEERVGAALEVQSRAENWEAYVEELQARDVPVFTSRYEIDGDVDDDRVTVDGSVAVAGERLYAELLRGLDDQQASAMDRSTARAIRDSRPEKARLVTTYGADGFHLEAGAAFGNLSALRDAIAEASDLPIVTEAVGRSDGDGGETTVRVAGAVSADASESSVRALPYVDDDTTVYMPGEGDREFPSMDVDRAETFLQSVEGSSAFGPGFGAIAAIAALLGAALVLVRRD